MEAHRRVRYSGFSDFGPSRNLRIALYSHDTLGLGHIRRNVLIARTIAQSPVPASILLIAGAREASAFSLAEGVDCLALPALCKEADGEYQTRSLDVPLEKLVEIRTATITAAMEAFNPDVFLVDKVARGALRELGPPLAEAFAQVDFQKGTRGVILTGPFMPLDVLERLYRLTHNRPQLRVIKFVTDPDILLSLADRVVAMGGYNTVCEVLSFEKPALIVPRIKPRQEQLIRARRLRDLGLIDMLHPHELCPDKMAEWRERPIL